MKQNITTDQWKEISEKQQNIMRDGWISNHPLEVFSLPTIGQMIEFLDEKMDSLSIDGSSKAEWCVEFYYPSGNYDHFHAKNPSVLCDSLWEAVKEVLSK